VQRIRNKKLITAAAYAKLRGLNRSTVSRQIRSGAIPTSGGGLIDPVAADAARERNLDPKKVAEHEHRKSNPSTSVETDSAPPAVDGDDATGGAPTDYWQIRTRLEEAKLAKAVRENLEAEGKLYEAEIMNRLWAEAGVMVRDLVMGIPNRVVARLPGEYQKQVALVVKEEARRALLAISSEWSKELGDRVARP
jgi:phage terminase Nu1 subunit (DNA packaging protein)